MPSYHDDDRYSPKQLNKMDFAYWLKEYDNTTTTLKQLAQKHYAQLRESGRPTPKDSEQFTRNGTTNVQVYAWPLGCHTKVDRMAIRGTKDVYLTKEGELVYCIPGTRTVMPLWEHIAQKPTGTHAIHPSASVHNKLGNDMKLMWRASEGLRYFSMYDPFRQYGERTATVSIKQYRNRTSRELSPDVTEYSRLPSETPLEFLMRFTLCAAQQLDRGGPTEQSTWNYVGYNKDSSVHFTAFNRDFKVSGQASKCDGWPLLPDGKYMRIEFYSPQSRRWMLFLDGNTSKEAFQGREHQLKHVLDMMGERVKKASLTPTWTYARYLTELKIPR